MTAIAEVAERIRANPAPVLIVDSCNFLDLFRVARPTKDVEERRVEIQELEGARRLLDLLTTAEHALHLVVPELVPGEVADNASAKVEQPFSAWLAAHDVNQQWLVDAAAAAGCPPLPTPAPVVPFDLQRHLRQFAERLLACATVLDRDHQCLLLAVERVIHKARPSHRKELKDSMNLEQTLELCRQLAVAGEYPHPLCFVSSNTNDFAEKGGIHPKLKDDFDKVSLLYFTSLRAARGHLLDNKYPV